MGSGPQFTISRGKLVALCSNHRYKKTHFFNYNIIEGYWILGFSPSSFNLFTQRDTKNYLGHLEHGEFMQE